MLERTLIAIVAGVTLWIVAWWLLSITSFVFHYEIPYGMLTASVLLGVFGASVSFLVWE